MPIYDYRCDHCQTTFEVRASFREKELGLKPMCTICQSAETHQILTVGLFVRQGSSDSGSITSTCCSPNTGTGCCG